MFKRIRNAITKISFTPVECEIYDLMDSQDWQVRSPHRNSFRDKYALDSWNTYDITFTKWPDMKVIVSDGYVTVRDTKGDVHTPISNSFRWYIHHIWVKGAKKIEREYEAERMNDALAYVKKSIT